MPAPTLPYPGFSWSFTQHTGPATQKETLFELLRTAYEYAGQHDYARLITEHLVAEHLLTENIRADAGEAQTWRDYQQVLPELGLIVSTRFTEGVVVTPVGLMWLDGSIGYSELMTTQCLRYQYPNGHKQDISPALRAELEAAGTSIPATRTELDVAHQVLIKPAVLILRILLELLRSGQQPVLTVQECLHALVPTRTNTDWSSAFSALQAVRVSQSQPASAGRLRHVQEWFRFLSLSDIFLVTGSAIRLTDVAAENATTLEQLCAYHEQPNTFWAPHTTDKAQIARSWFNYYGNPEILSQWVMPEDLRSVAYVSENYPDGLEKPEDWAQIQRVRQWAMAINPQQFVPPQLEPLPGRPIQLSYDDLLRQAQGQVRRARSSRLHEDIVALVAGRLQAAGCSVAEDPFSVDLLASLNDRETIIEVKTVTPANLNDQIRLGVGQLAEYRYRRESQTGSRPLGILVISSSYDFPSWYTDYLSNDIRLGLVSRAAIDRFRAHTHANLEHLIAQ